MHADSQPQPFCQDPEGQRGRLEGLPQEQHICAGGPGLGQQLDVRVTYRDWRNVYVPINISQNP